MKLVSWNVNGFKSIISKNFNEVFNTINADIFCIIVILYWFYVYESN